MYGLAHEHFLPKMVMAAGGYMAEVTAAMRSLKKGLVTSGLGRSNML